mmetsp:Transcript_8661/g.16353  ORF Transcript_8661/g.16353 Transcript_8661/m.16353 type:complete len:184 (-) Transcript_8661:56-607(-)
MSQLLKLNSFMITENQKYGMNLNELQKINEALEKEEEKNREIEISLENNSDNCHSGHYDLSFLYKRESDKIGHGIALSEYPLAKELRKKQEKRQRPLLDRKSTEASSSAPSTLSKNDVMRVLEAYHHDPKEENPLFTTTAKEIGSKKPSLATYNAQRHYVTQSFTKSFNNIMFRDHGLNTSKN